MSDLHSWILNYQRRALTSDDPQLNRLAYLLNRFWLHGDKNYDQDLAVLAEARAVAEKLGEGRVVLYVDHWRAQWLLHRKRDYLQARDVVIPAILEVRKPAYDTLPQRVCLHEDAIKTYIGLDVYGYVAQIDQALAYMDAQIAPQQECRLCHCGLWIDYALETERLDLAEQWAMRYLALAQSPDLGSEHHETYAYEYLAQTAARRGDWARALRWTAPGLELAERTELANVRWELLALQGLAAQGQGDAEAARGLLQSALRQALQSGRPLAHSFYDACCAFHERDGQAGAALELRRRELAELEGSGRLVDECRCRIELCRLLGLLGSDRAAELAEARAAIQRLGDPAPLLAQLEALGA
jgi:hypothetical protein